MFRYSSTEFILSEENVVLSSNGFEYVTAISFLCLIYLNFQRLPSSVIMFQRIEQTKQWKPLEDVMLSLYVDPL